MTEQVRLLRLILRLLLAMAEWQFLAGAGGPSRETYFGLRDVIDAARKENV